MEELGKKLRFTSSAVSVETFVDKVRNITELIGYDVTLRDFSSPSDLVFVQRELSLLLRHPPTGTETKSIGHDEPSLYPFTDNKIWADVQKERIRQIHLHGVQDHPCTVKDRQAELFVEILGSILGQTEFIVPNQICRSYGVPTEEEAKFSCGFAFASGTPTYAHIAVEELSEAISELDPVKRYQEVIQLATVALAWAEKIKRIDLKESEK